MKPSTGAAVRLHRNAVRDRPDSLAAFKRNACPLSAESAPKILPAGLFHSALGKYVAWSIFRIGAWISDASRLCSGVAPEGQLEGHVNRSRG
jgi:hypothetical protein